MLKAGQVKTATSEIDHHMKSLIKNHEQGYAMIMVIWVMAILTLLAFAYSSQLRISNATLGNSASLNQVNELSQAAIERGISALLNPAQEGPYKRDGTPYQFLFHNALLSFSLEDERGKIDLNFAENELLLSLFEAAPVYDTGLTGQEILDRLLDWRDQDDQVRQYGAESSDYQLAGYEYVPANQALISTSEFQQLLGTDRALYDAIYPYVTVHSYEGTINPLYAPQGVLRVLPGTNDREVDLYIAARTKNPFFNPQNSLPDLEAIDKWLDDENGSVYTITGRAETGAGLTYLKQVILWLPDQDEQNVERYRILEVREDNQSSIMDKFQNSTAVMLE